MTIILAWLLFFITPFVEANELENLCSKVQSGDLIFQKSRSYQSQAIKEVTGSLWSHVGVIFKYDGKTPKKFIVRVKEGKHVMFKKAKKGCFVMEAIQPVSAAKLMDFVGRSETIGGKRHFAIKRYKNIKLDINKLVKSYNKLKGRSYDLIFHSRFKNGKVGNYYEFDFKKDQNSYCSELAWMLYAEQGYKIGKWTTVGKLLSKIKVSEKTTPILLSLEKRRLRRQGRTLKSLGQNPTITPLSIFVDNKFNCIYGCPGS